MINAFVGLCLILVFALFLVVYAQDRRLERIENRDNGLREEQEQALWDALFSIRYSTEDEKNPDLYEPVYRLLKSLCLNYPDLRAKVKVDHDSCIASVQNKEPEKSKFALVPVVFSLPECPSDANWAAVDADGSAYWYVDKPVISGKCWVRRQTNYAAKCILPEAFDSTDWQHSLIKRPERKALEVTMADIEKKYGCKVKIVKGKSV